MIGEIKAWENPYESTQYNHVYRVVETGKYIWVDETGEESETKYKTAEAEAVLGNYISWLNQRELFDFD